MRQKGKVSITFVAGYKICDTVTFPERPSQRLVLSPQFSGRHSLTLMLKIESLTHVGPVFSFPWMIVQRVCLLQKHDIDVHLHQIWASHSWISHMWQWMTLGGLASKAWIDKVFLLISAFHLSLLFGWLFVCPAMVTSDQISLLLAPHPQTHTFSESLW